MSSDDRDLIRGAAAWIAKTDRSNLDVGLSREEARRRAADLIRALRAGERPSAEAPLTDADIDVLHAANELLTERFAGASPSDEIAEAPALYDVIASMPPPGSGYEQTGMLADSTSLEPTTLLDDARRLYDYVSTARWPEPDFDERAELMADIALVGWRTSRQLMKPKEIDKWLRDFHSTALSLSDLTRRVDNLFVRAAKGSDLEDFSDLPILLTILQSFRKRWEIEPPYVYDKAAMLYGFSKARNSKPTLEYHYFLGELALITGVTCRNLGRRDEGQRWLALAKDEFRHDPSGSIELARVEYQELAIRLEERDFATVIQRIPALVAEFEIHQLDEDALKVRFLEAVVLAEMGHHVEALRMLGNLVEQAESLNNEYLLGLAFLNLAVANAFLGNEQQSLEFVNKAVPLMRRSGNGIGLAKLTWSVAILLVARRKVQAALLTFRMAEEELRKLGMTADEVAVKLQIADLLIDEGEEGVAEQEIRQALPIIEEYKLLPEGFAALSLLRESLRRQKIDRQALRDLHSHFKKDDL
jgi:tetratricopeptide (TPR) repeat protein